MKEREDNIDPYWQIDQAVGEGDIQGERYTIRVQVHRENERRWERREIVPLAHKTGDRTYFHARPYILVPDITLTIGLAPTPSTTGKIGEVLSSEWEGMRHQEIGNAQAWYYVQDRTLVLWECYLHDFYKRDNPLEDEALRALWAGFERFLLDHCPGAERIATPSWEDIYEPDLWQQFLKLQGYRPFNDQAFVKEAARL